MVTVESYTADKEHSTGKDDTLSASDFLTPSFSRSRSSMQSMIGGNITGCTQSLTFHPSAGSSQNKRVDKGLRDLSIDVRSSIDIIKDRSRMSSGGGSSTLVGSGIQSSQTWAIGKHKRMSVLRAHSIGSVEIVGGKTDKVTIIADDNIMSKLSATLQGESLCIESDAKCTLEPKIPIVYTVQLCPTRLAALTSLFTSMRTHVKTHLTSTSLFISSTGTSDIIIEKGLKVSGKLSLLQCSTGMMKLARIAVKRLEVNHASTGRVIIAGDGVSRGVLNILDAGSIEARKLMVNKLTLTMCKQGSLECAVHTAVSGTLWGTGCFTNYGKGSADRLQLIPPARYRQIIEE